MKHVKCSEKTRSKRGVFFGSLLTIVLSCVLFVGVTLAWFSATYSAPQITMKAANFDAELTVVKDGNQHTIANSCELENGTYELTLKRIGTSSESRGYCRIAIPDKGCDVCFHAYAQSDGGRKCPRNLYARMGKCHNRRLCLAGNH